MRMQKYVIFFDCYPVKNKFNLGCAGSTIDLRSIVLFIFSNQGKKNPTRSINKQNGAMHTNILTYSKVQRTVSLIY